MEKTDKTFAMQYTLRALGKNVQADGLLGNQTRSAISSLSGQERQILTTLQNQLPNRRSTVPGRIFFTSKELADGIGRVSSEQSVPNSFLADMVELENYVVPGGVETTTTGNFRGLGQFNRTTWDALIRLGANLPPWERGVTTVLDSLRAAAYLWKENRRAYLQQNPGRIFTDEIAYLYHNQGAPAAVRFLRTGKLVYPDQSDKAVRVAAVARSQHEKENWA